jgi:zinc and cadmium transporter
MWINVQLSLCCALIGAASLFGGWIPSLLKMTHNRLQLTLSFVGGLMLGAAFLHLIPHSFHHTNSIDVTMSWAAAGLLIVFLLIRWFHVHHHSDSSAVASTEPTAASDGQRDDAHNCSGHGGDHTHGEDDIDAVDHCSQHSSPLSWVGLLLGMSIHSLLDGVALASGLLAEASHGTTAWLGSPAILLAVMLHKPIDSLTIAAVVGSHPTGQKWKSVVNIAFAATTPIGVLAFVWGLQNCGNIAIGAALAFSGGVFVCVSLADLLPEVRFHSHDRVKLTAALLLGFATAYAVGMLESEEAHPPGNTPHEEHSGHSHEAAHVPIRRSEEHAVRGDQDQQVAIAVACSHDESSSRRHF